MNHEIEVADLPMRTRPRLIRGADWEKRESVEFEIDRDSTGLERATPHSAGLKAVPEARERRCSKIAKA